MAVFPSLLHDLFAWAAGILLVLVLARVVLYRGNPVKPVIGLIVVNALADVTTNYFDGALTPGLFRFVLLVAVVALVVPRVRHSPVSRLIFAFSVYTWVLIWFSSQVGVSAGMWFKVSLPMWLFPVGYTFFRGVEGGTWFRRAVFAAMTIIVVQVGLAQVFRLGGSVYIEDSFYLGGGLVEITYTLVIGLSLLPILLPGLTSTQRSWSIGLAIAAITAVLLYVRRGSYAGLAASGLVYAFASPQRSRLLIGTAVLAAGLLLASPLYSDLLLERIEGRGLRERSLSEEGRFKETFYVANDLRQRGALGALTGTELYNSAEYFRPVMYGRQLHTDFSVLLHGAGAIGLSLYAFVFLVIAYRAYALSDRQARSRALRASVWALCSMNAVLSLSGTLGAAGYRSLLFLSLGLLIGQLERGRRLQTDGSALPSEASHVSRGPRRLRRSSPLRSGLPSGPMRRP